MLRRSISMSKLSNERLKQLKEKVKMAELINERKLLPQTREALQRYTGLFIPNIGTDWDVILNEIYPVIQFNLPSIFFRNPRAFLKPKTKTFLKKVRNPLSGKMETVQGDSTLSARTQEHIVNYEMHEMRYKDEVRKVLMDSLIFTHGILWHGYKGDFGMTEEKSYFIKNEKIFVKRISPLRFGKDPAVGIHNMDEGEFVYRRIDMPMMDVLEDKNLKITKQLKGFAGFGDEIPKGGMDVSYLPSSPQVPTTLLDVTSDEFKRSHYSKFIKLYEVYLRPSKKERQEGKPGKILLLTDEQDEPLRESDWTVKAEGFPAKALEFNPVPDQMFGMPDMDTYKQIADQKNAIVNLQLRNAQENSKVYVGLNKGEIDNEEDLEHIQKGDQTIILFGGDTPVGQRMSVQSAGGAASDGLS